MTDIMRIDRLEERQAVADALKQIADLRAEASRLEDSLAVSPLKDEDGEPIFCMVTGLPVLEDDEYFQDPGSYDTVLRLAVVPEAQAA